MIPINGRCGLEIEPQGVLIWVEFDDLILNERNFIENEDIQKGGLGATWGETEPRSSPKKEKGDSEVKRKKCEVRSTSLKQMNEKIIRKPENQVGLKFDIYCPSLIPDSSASSGSISSLSSPLSTESSNSLDGTLVARKVRKSINSKYPDMNKIADQPKRNMSTSKSPSRKNSRSPPLTKSPTKSSVDELSDSPKLERKRRRYASVSYKNTTTSSIISKLHSSPKKKEKAIVLNDL